MVLKSNSVASDIIVPNFNTRDNYVWLWIGTNTTGKTPTAIMLAIAIKRERPNSKIVCFDNRKSIRKMRILNPLTKKYELLADKIIEEWDTDWAEQLLGVDKDGKRVSEPWRNYTLFLDDYQMLCKNYKMPQGFKSLIAMRVEYNIDIIGITHTPKYILEGIKDQVTDYSIFYNLSKQSSFEDKIANYEKVQAGAIVINEYALKFGWKTYPKFPYVHVNQKTGKVTYVNMPWENIKQLDCFKYLKVA